jgi:hypothetical protein
MDMDFAVSSPLVRQNFEIVGQPIPEPATMGLVGLGLVTLWVLSRKRWRKQVL